MEVEEFKAKVFKSLSELTDGKFPKIFKEGEDMQVQLRQLAIKLQGDRPIVCVHCGHERVHSKGLYKGGRRYTCNKCGKTFNDLTGTAFSGIRKLDLMFEFMGRDFFNGTAVRNVGSRLGIDYRTVFYWRHKLDTALKSLTSSLSEDIVSLLEITKLISLKGSMHESGQRYPDDPEVEVWEWHGQRYVSGVVAHDLSSHSYMRIVDVGSELERLKSGALLSRWVGEGKRVVVPRDGVMIEVGQGLRRGKRRVVCEGGLGVSQRWKHLSHPREVLDIAQKWGVKFRGVATKYLDNYCSIISWYVAHFEERNWYARLVEGSLLSRGVSEEYRKRKKVKVELEGSPQRNAI